jgi:hypothetical protein
MVSSVRRMEPLRLAEVLAIVRRGVMSLTITGPFPALEETRRQALARVRERPTQAEREAALSQALQESTRAMELLQRGNHPGAATAMQEMYTLAKSAIATSRRAL